LVQFSYFLHTNVQTLSCFHSASRSFYKHNMNIRMHNLFRRINVWLNNSLLPDPIVLVVDSSKPILRKSKPNFKPKDGNLPYLNKFCVPMITRKTIQLTNISFFMVFHLDIDQRNLSTTLNLHTLMPLVLNFRLGRIRDHHTWYSFIS